MFRTFSAFVLALGLALFAGSSVRATPLPPDQVNWNYNWVPGQSSIGSTNTPAGSITFTNEPANNATGSSDIVATNLRTASTLPANTPNTLTFGPGGHYTLSLTLTQVENGTTYTGTHTFGGTLSGSWSGESANVKNMFDTGTGGSWNVQLGSYDFAVTLDAYTPPGPPTQVQTGSVSAHVEVSIHDNGEPGPVLNETPEPSSMLLGGLAITFFGGAAWRKRRKAQQSQ